MKVTKITSRISVSLTCNGPFWFFLLFWFSEMVVLSKVCKPDNFKPCDSLNLRFTNIQCLESNTSDILALYETNLKDLTDSSSIFVRGYRSLVRKDTLLKCLVVYVKEGFAFAWNSSLENSEYSYLCFQLAFFCSVFYFFSIYQSIPSCLCSVLDFISSSKDEILSMNP